MEKVVITVTGIACIYLAATLTGCAALIGIKEYKGSDGSVMKFVTGYDIGASASGVDTIDNRKGINTDLK